LDIAGLDSEFGQCSGAKTLKLINALEHERKLTWMCTDMKNVSSAGIVVLGWYRRWQKEEYRLWC